MSYSRNSEQSLGLSVDHRNLRKTHSRGKSGARRSTLQTLAELLEKRTMLTLPTLAQIQAAVGPNVVARTSAHGLELAHAPRSGVYTPQYVALDANPQLTASGTLAPFATSSPTGLSPAIVRHAYGVDQVMFGSIVGNGAGQTIAIVDAYDYPTAATDLQAFDLQFGLPDPPSITRVNQTGGTTLPGVDPAGKGNDWEIEEALDVDWAHAMAPGASILLVEANSPTDADLITAAVGYARTVPGVVAVTMSFGRAENSNDTTLNQLFTTPAGHAGVTFLASTGDNGAPGGFPAYSPNVVAVGGTTLSANSSGGYVSETGWSGSGGGISTYESQPSYQSGVVTQSTTKRTIPDVSFDADPNSGVPIYDSYDFGTATPWAMYGGTSLSSPCWAGLIAVADQGRTINGGNTLDGPGTTLPKLYSIAASNYHDITSGNNGFSAGVGYDLVTGRGSPVFNKLVTLGAAGPTVTNATPVGIQSTASSSASFTFSGAMNTSSFSVSTGIASFTGPGGVDELPTVSGYAWSNGNTTLTINFTPLSVQGLYSIVIGPQILSVSGAAMDQNQNGIAGEVPGDRYTDSFNYDSTPLSVVSTSPSNGAIISGGTVTLSVNFNYPIDPTTAAPSNLQLSSGSVTGDTVLNGNTTVQYTIAGLNTEGTLTAAIPFGAIKDANGNPLVTAYSGSFIVDNQLLPLPTPFVAGLPAGSQIYSSNVSDGILFAGDHHTFTVTLDANQQFTIVGTAAATLQETVQLLDPSSNVLATATAPGPGQSVVLQSVPINSTGVYSIVVTGANSSTGAFGVTATLNAAADLQNYGLTNSNTLGTAQNVSGAFMSVGGGGQRAAEFGSNLPTGGAGAVYSNNFENGLGGFTIDNTPASGLWHLSTGRGSQSGHSATNSVYFGLGESATGGGTYNTGTRVSGYLNSPSITLPTGTSTLSFNYVLKTENYSSYDLAEVMISTNGGTSYSLLKQYNSLAESTTWTSSSVSLAAYGGQTVKLRWMFDTLDSISNGFEGWYVDDVVVASSATVAPNYYSFSVNAGDSVTLALKSTSGSASDIKLLNSAGTILTQYAQAASGVDEIINDFIAPAAGTYYAQVTGANATSYDLIITKNSDFSTASAAGTAGAQKILSTPTSGDQRVLGHVFNGLADTYSITLTAGSPLMLTTSTPGGGTGQFPNSLDPKLRLLSSAGTQLALDDNSAGDGRNAQITYLPTTSGTYYIEVSSTSTSTTTGDYVLDANGATVSYPAFLVTTTTPVNNSSITTAPTTITVNFNQQFYQPTMLAGDLKLDGVAATSVTFSNNSQAVFTLPSYNNSGTHTFSFVAGSLLDLQQIPISGFSGQFTVVGASAVPGTPILSSASDTGFNNSDGITSLNNSGGKTLVFTISNTTSGATVNLYAGTTLIGSAVATGTSVTLTTNGTVPLANATYSITATQTTPGLSASPASGAMSLQVLNTIPGTPSAPLLQTASDSGISSFDGITNITTPVFSNSITTPYYRLYRNGTLVSGNYATGTFTSASLADGSYSFQVTAVDVAGNESAKSSIKTVVIDTVAPAAPAGPALDPASDSGSSSSDGITNVTTPTLDVTTVESGTAYTYLDGGIAPVGQTGAGGSGMIQVAGPTANATFASPLIYEAGTTPTAVYTADLNGDSKLDLMTDNGSGFSELLGNGNGTFQTPVLISTVVSYDFVITDLNGDGKKDLVVSSTNGVQMLAGNGDGTFQSPILISNSGGQGYEVRAADLNGDGTTDLVIGTSLFGSGYIILTLTNNGSNSFTTHQYSMTGQPQDMAVADFNGDGRADVAVSTNSPVTLQILLGNGDGTFTTGTPVTSVLPFNLAAGDFNSDGKMDLAVAGISSTQYVLLGNGNGTFQAPSSVVGGSASGALVGDFNGDGKLDFASSINTAPDTLLVEYGNGDGTLQSPVKYTLPSSSTQHLVMGDFDQNGHPDIAIACSSLLVLLDVGGKLTEGTHTFTARVSDAAGNLSAASAATTITVDLTAPAAPAAPSLFSGSDNGISRSDGITNLTSLFLNATAPEAGAVNLYEDGSVLPVGSTVVAGAGGTSVYIPNTTSTTFSSSTNYGVGGFSQGVRAADVNGDGKLDLVVPCSNGVSVLLGNGDGTFQAAKTTSYSASTDLVAGDFTGDGKLDLLVLGNGAMALLNGNGDGTFGSATTISAYPGFTPYSLLSVDVNHDGKMDVVVDGTTSTGAGVLSLVSNGNGTFTQYLAAFSGLAKGMDAADFNGDGRTDLAVTTGSAVQILLGNSDGTFTVGNALAVPTANYVSAADLNGDGKIDLAVTDPGEFKLKVLLGSGNGSFLVKQTIGFSGSPTGLVIGDFNSDGFPDVATSVALFPNYFEIAYGNGDGTLQAPMFFTTSGAFSRGLLSADLDNNGHPDLVYASNSTSSVYVNLISGGKPADGIHTFAVRVQDAAGNLSPVSGSISVTIMLSTPVTPAAPVLEAASDTGVSQTDGITNNTRPVFDVLATPYFNVYQNGVLVRTFVSGTSFTPNTLTKGTYVYTIAVVDAAGNVSQQSTGTSVTILTGNPPVTGAPVLEASSDSGVSSNDGITNITTPVFDVTGAPYFRMFRDGSAVSGPYMSGPTFTSAALPDGTYSFSYQAVDAAGNLTYQGSTNITIQTAKPSAPAAPALQAASDSGVTHSDGITNLNALTFNMPAVSYFRLYRDGTLISGNYSTGTSYIAASQPEGSWSYTVTAVDSAGNESAASSATPVTIDNTPPAAVLSAVASNTPVDAETLTFSEAVSGMTIASLSLSLNGGPNLLDGTETLSTIDNKTWTIGNLAAFTAAPGNYTLSVASNGITDTAGNALVGGPSVSWSLTTAGVNLDGSAGNIWFYLQLDSTGSNLNIWQIPFTAGPTPLVPPASAPTVTYAISSLSGGLNITGGGAPNVSVILDDSMGIIAPSGGINFIAGTSATGDGLTVLLPSNGASATVNGNIVAVNASSGVHYTGLSTITIDGAAGDDTLTQTAQPAANLIFNGATGNDTLNINGGSFSFASNPSLTTADLTLNDNSTVNFLAGSAGNGLHLLKLDALNIGPAAVAQFSDALNHADRSLLVTGGLTIATGGKLDLSGNDAIIRGGNLNTVNMALSTGLNAGRWTGSGIASTAASQDPTYLTALAAITNDDGAGNPLYGSGGALGTFDGQSPALGDVLIKYTYYGDTNLDGAIDGSDYTRIDSGFLAQASTWFNGDINYDHFINGSDYTLMDNAFNTQGASLAASVSTSATSAAEIDLPTTAQTQTAVKKNRSQEIHPVPVVTGITPFSGQTLFANSIDEGIEDRMNKTDHLDEIFAGLI